MSCDRELLDLYVAGALEGDRVVDLERHLATCVACRTEERETRKLLAQVAAEPRPDPGDAFFVDMSREIRKACADVDARPRGVVGWMKSFWRPIVVVGLAASAAAAILVIVSTRHGAETKSVAKTEAPAAEHKKLTIPKVNDVEDMDDEQLDRILSSFEEDEQPVAEDEDEDDVLGDDTALHDTMEDLDEEELDRVYAALEKGV